MRKCLPLTGLSQETVDRAPLSAEVRRELAIREVERELIEGDPARLAKWRERRPWVGHLADTKFYAEVDYAALEQRIVTQHVTHEAAVECGPGCPLCSFFAMREEDRPHFDVRGLPPIPPDTRKFVHNYDDLFPR